MTAPTRAVDSTAPDTTALKIGAVDVAALVRTFGADALARRAGDCSWPVRLRGSRLHVHASTGQILARFDSSGLPGGVLPVRCGNRRTSVCQPCATLYKYDAHNLIAAGCGAARTPPPRSPTVRGCS